MIRENIQKLFQELPENIKLVAAVKSRNINEIIKAIDAGIDTIGENYVQEAESLFTSLGQIVQYHFIGHLQTNKVKKAIEIFDMIETVDSIKIATEINQRCAQIGKIMPILIEVNSGREPQKYGVMPEDIENLIKWLTSLSHIKVMGLMTMGPLTDNPEQARPYFIEARKCFEKIKSLNISNVNMQYLSMGMSDTYKIALEEGANVIRIGTKIFGPRTI